MRNADDEIRGLAEQGIVLKPDTEAEYRQVIADYNAANPDPEPKPPSKSTVKRVAAQKPPVKRRK